MWWVKEHRNHSRGGFQDRDVGRTQFDNDYGPDYGIDYARFSDPPNTYLDAKLQKDILEELALARLEMQDLEVTVRNGFVILKGTSSDEGFKSRMKEVVSRIPQVKVVIDQLSVPQKH